MRWKSIDPSEVSGKEVARNVHILIASSYFKNICFRPVIIRNNKTSPVVHVREIDKLHLQVKRNFRYLHHVTWHDSRTPTRSWWFAPPRPRRASVLLLLALSYSFFAASLSFYFLIVISSFTRRSFSYSTDFVAIAGCVGICRTCCEPTIMHRIPSIKYCMSIIFIETWTWFQNLNLNIWIKFLIT